MKPAVIYEPCAHCPFRTDRPAFLTKARAREIMQGIDRDQHFDCHKTVDYDDEGDAIPSSKRAICAGFAIIAERRGRPTQMMRIAERVGAYDARRLNMDAPTHKTATAFIKAQPE